MRSLSEILEDIDKIDWSVMQHAYGEASDVPDLLRGLVSEDEDLRLQSLYGLCETIWHQGTVYEASLQTVPFLLEMLKLPGVSGKSGIVLLVAELADGESTLALYANDNDEISRIFREYLKQEGRDFEEELENEKSYIQAIREAVGPEIELLFEYLKDEEPEVRDSVARTLTRFPHRALEIIPLLENALTSETEDYVGETMKTAIVELKSHL